MNPPTTNSCRNSIFSLSQLRERFPGSYRESVRLAMMPSQPWRRASLSIFFPSPSMDSVTRSWAEPRLPMRLTSLARRSDQGSLIRMSSSPSARMSKRMSAAGVDEGYRSIACGSFTCIRLCSSWNLAGSPSVSATISPSSTSDRFGLGSQLLERSYDFRELRRLVLAVPRHEPHLGGGGEGEDTNAVVLGLERPPLARDLTADAGVHRLE